MMCFCDKLVVTKSLKMQVKIGSLLICLLCLDTTLVPPKLGQCEEA